MDIAILDTTTSPETAAHLDSLHAAAKEAYEDWGAATQQDDYETGRIAYADAYDEFQTAVSEAWGLPHPELDAPV